MKYIISLMLSLAILLSSCSTYNVGISTDELAARTNKKNHSKRDKVEVVYSKTKSYTFEVTKVTEHYIEGVDIKKKIVQIPIDKINYITIEKIDFAGSIIKVTAVTGLLLGIVLLNSLPDKEDDRFGK